MTACRRSPWIGIQSSLFLSSALPSIWTLENDSGSGSGRETSWTDEEEKEGVHMENSSSSISHPEPPITLQEEEAEEEEERQEEDSYLQVIEELLVHMDDVTSSLSYTEKEKKKQKLKLKQQHQQLLDIDSVFNNNRQEEEAYSMVHELFNFAKSLKMQLRIKECRHFPTCHVPDCSFGHEAEQIMEAFKDPRLIGFYRDYARIAPFEISHDKQRRPNYFAPQQADSFRCRLCNRPRDYLTITLILYSKETRHLVYPSALLYCKKCKQQRRLALYY
jgi:hypothetical protein